MTTRPPTAGRRQFEALHVEPRQVRTRAHLDGRRDQPNWNATEMALIGTIGRPRV